MIAAKKSRAVIIAVAQTVVASQPGCASLKCPLSEVAISTAIMSQL
jgi:hypothetical protein